jgi:hypothetical protein
VMRWAASGPGLVAAGLAMIVAGVAGVALSPGGGPVPRPAATVPVPPGPAAAGPGPAARRPALPRELTIPVIGVRTRLVRLGLTPGGALQVPGRFQVAGWYDNSPRPGEAGAAVIAGHVDNLAGPAVFYRLAALRPGDRVYIRRADGSLVVFQVTTVRRYLKARFPTAAVYGPAPGPQLRLITCGGTFDPARHSYLSNVVVYAVAGPVDGPRPGHPVRRGPDAPGRPQPGR